MMSSDSQPAAAVRSCLGARPLWQHSFALLGVLLVLVPIVGTDSAFVTDESLLVIQLDTIERTNGWTIPHPLPEVDPEGVAFPLHDASRYDSGYLPYGRHPGLVYLYLPVHRALGIVGLLLVSVLGTWAAALVAACLARRIRPDAARLALWIVGIASPLFFDAFVIHAHTVAAAIGGLAMLLALQCIERRRVLVLIGILAAALVVTMIRTEAVFFVAALSGALGLVGVLRRRADLIVGAGGVLGSGAAAFLVDRRWAGIVAAGQAVPTGRSGVFESVSFLEGRASSLSYTLVLPGYRGSLAESIAVVGVMLIVLGLLVMRRRPDDQGARLLPAAGALMLLLRGGLQWGPIPGLLIAFLVGTAGLALLRGAAFSSMTTRFLLAVVGAYAAGVMLTQYPYGGHTEWGGRFFAMAVPALAAIAAASLKQQMEQWPSALARSASLSLAVGALGISLLALTTLRASHERNRERSDGVLAAAAAMPGTDDSPPIVVTEDEQIPRLARGRLHEVRFLLVTPRSVGTYLRRLAALDVGHLLVVSSDPVDTLNRVPASYAQVGSVIPHKSQYDDGGGLIRLRLQDAPPS